MPWFNKDEANAENTEAGKEPTPEKTPAELIAESLGAALKPISDTLNTFTSRLDTLEKNTTRPTPTPTPSEIPSVFEDENAAIMHRIAPVMQRQLETEARIALTEAKAEYVAQGYGELWTQVEPELKQTLDNSPLVDGQGKVVRGDPTYIRNVVDMIFGRSARKAGMKFGGRDKGFFVEAAGGDGGSTQAGPTDDGLSAEQRRVFERMGVPTADARKTMAKLKFVH